jgi:hypothetical protein
MDHKKRNIFEILILNLKFLKSDATLETFRIVMEVNEIIENYIEIFIKPISFE